jgi:hypothetical protein
MPRTILERVQLTGDEFLRLWTHGGLRVVPGLVVELWFAALSRTWYGGPKLDSVAADCLQ